MHELRDAAICPTQHMDRFREMQDRAVFCDETSFAAPDIATEIAAEIVVESIARQLRFDPLEAFSLDRRAQRTQVAADGIIAYHRAQSRVDGDDFSMRGGYDHANCFFL